MKVFNLTDVATATLTNHKLVDHTFAVGPGLVAPGESVEVPPEYVDTARAGIQELVALGALAVGEQPPASYLLAKSKQSKPTTSSVPPPAPVKASKPPPAAKAASVPPPPPPPPPEAPAEKKD